LIDFPKKKEQFQATEPSLPLHNILNNEQSTFESHERFKKLANESFEMRQSRNLKI
jgi:hypothetical protein